MRGPRSGQPIAYAQQLWSGVNMSKPRGPACLLQGLQGNGATAPGSYDRHDLDQSFAMLADHGGARRRRIAAECSDGNQVFVGLEV
jgi:hypothetical protein